MLKARQGKEIVLRTANKIGALAAFSKIVAERGVNILGMSAWVEDGEAVVRLVTDDLLRTMDVLREHNYAPQERNVVMVDAPINQEFCAASPMRWPKKTSISHTCLPVPPSTRIRASSY